MTTQAYTRTIWLVDQYLNGISCATKRKLRLDINRSLVDQKIVEFLESLL